MATVMCTKRLWEMISGGDPFPEDDGPGENPWTLGLWGAKPVELPEGNFCVALHDTTFLTLVFRLEPLPSFMECFTRAVVCELEHQGIPEAKIRREVAESFRQVSFARHNDRSLLGSLNDIGHHLDWALSDARRSTDDVLAHIQHQLNVMPHCKRDIKLPDQAVSLLFSEGECM